MTEVIVTASSIQGLGLFANRDFERDETVLVLDDSRVVDDAHPLRPEMGEYDYHCDYLAGGRTVLQAFPERHINSSCNPNTYVKTIGGLRFVLAWRRISAGDEITYDYILNCHGGIEWQCHCGSEICRGTVPPSFFDLPLETQLEYLPLLDDWFVAEHREKVAALRARANGWKS